MAYVSYDTVISHWTGVGVLQPSGKAIMPISAGVVVRCRMSCVDAAKSQARSKAQNHAD